MPSPPITPPINSVVDILGWAVAVILFGLLAIWRLREKDRSEADKKAEEARVEQLGALKAMLDDREATIARLGKKLDDEREELKRKLEESERDHKRDLERAAHAITQRSSPAQAMRGASQWEELPTGMRNMLDLVAEALRPPPPTIDPFPDLEDWSPDKPTPPAPPRPRAKMPSRPR